jgi:protein TonB
MRQFIAVAAVACGFFSRAAAQTPPPLLARPPERPVATITVEGEERWRVAISHPTPKYPTEARRKQITGKGFYHLHVSYETGEVTSVDILTSAGHPMLDDSALATLKHWKFKPHTIIGLKVPITFSISRKT